MNSCRFITTLRQLTLSEEMRGSWQFMPGLEITNDPKEIRRILLPEFRAAIGEIEYRFLCASTNLVFGEYPASDPSRKQLGPDSFLWVILTWVQGLLKNAWLLKDHAIQCESAYLVVFQERGLANWSTNRVAGRPRFSDGQGEGTVKFSMEELERWTELNNRVEGYLHEKDSMGFPSMMDKGFSRFGRALQFVNSARHSSNITIRISQYCTALETLFTTDTAELSHKLSERVAFFLGQAGFNRVDVFKTVKAAYGVRSKTTHGDTLNQKQIEDLSRISGQSDEYLRTIMNLILSDEDTLAMFDGKNEGIEAYFEELILGSSFG